MNGEYFCSVLLPAKQNGAKRIRQRCLEPNKTLILHLVRSKEGIGAVLGQIDDEGRENMIACICSLDVHERSYSSPRGEVLAAVWAVMCGGDKCKVFKAKLACPEC